MSKTQKSNHRYSSLAVLLKKIGKKEKINIDIESHWGCVGSITKNNGTKTYFRGTSFDLNGLGSTKIAKDKGYAAYFLKQAGYNVIGGETFYSYDFAKALKNKNNPNSAYYYAEKIGFPVVVKPNSSTQGKLVCVCHNKKTFTNAVKKICKIDRVFLVQPLTSGRDYRILVLDNEVLSAYERTPFCVIGNGHSTIDKLIDEKIEQYSKNNRPINIKKDDFRIDDLLKRHKISRSKILPVGKYLSLLDNCNLSSGGDAHDVLDEIDPTYKKLAIDITREMGLRYSGIDLLVQNDIRKPLDQKKNTYSIIEINAAPGVNHYAKSGRRQMKIVYDIYKKILRALVK
jgi:D-alanine-D-alanine ligase-like ATP-grasp enzyme